MGKARRFNVYDNDIKNSRNAIEMAGRTRQDISGIGSSFRTLPTLPPQAIGGSNKDDTKLSLQWGGQLQTAIGFKSETDDIETGNLDITTNSAGAVKQSRGLIFVTPESGTADVLDTITGKLYDGQFLILTGISGNTITITHNHASAGRILCPGNVNYTLSGDDVCILIHDVTAGTLTWRLFGGGGGGSGVTFPITPSVNDQGSTWTSPVTIDLSASNAHITKFTLDANLTIAFSNPPASGTQIEFEVEFLQDATGGRTVTWPVSVVETITISSPPNTLSIVTLRTNDGGTTYHAITTLAGTISGGGGDFANKALSNLTATSINEHLVPSATATKNLGSTTVFWANAYMGTLNLGDATDIQTLLGVPTGIEYNVKTGDTHTFLVNSVTKVILGNSTASFAVGVVPSVTATHDLGDTVTYWSDLFVGTVNFGDDANNETIIGVPTGLEYNVKTGDTHLFLINNVEKMRVGGSTVSFSNDIVPAVDATYNLGDSVTKFAALFVTNVRFDASTQFITADANGMRFEVPTGDTFGWEINNVEAMQINTSLNLDMNDHNIIDLNSLDFQDGHSIGGSSGGITITMATADELTVNTDTVQFEISGNTPNAFFLTTSSTLPMTLELFRSDASPTDADVMGELKFVGRDSAGNQTEFAKISGVGKDITNTFEEGELNFLVSDVGTLVEIMSMDVQVGARRISFFGGTPAIKQTVTGDRFGNTALADLLTDMATYGLITDSTTNTNAWITRINGSSGAAGAYLTWQNLTANSATFQNALTTIMTTTGVGAGTWKYKYTIIYQSSAAGTGIGFAINHTGTSTVRQNMWWFVSTGSVNATGIADEDTATVLGQMVEGKAENVKNATIGSTSGGVVTANVNQIAILEGVINVTVSGSLEFRAIAETANNCFIAEDTILELCKVE